MSRLTSSLVAAAAVGQLVGQLGWIDLLFIPLVLLGPVITGAVAAARRTSYAWAAVMWWSVGISMLWTDWVVNHEDVVFHFALSVMMPLLAGLGFGVVKLASSFRAPAHDQH
ncbi:MAG: hypothetical protein JWN96_1166 [Mycobacterium sp.]|nr:hypothetical protein [Mycobacterium sp.]